MSCTVLFPFHTRTHILCFSFPFQSGHRKRSPKVRGGPGAPFPRQLATRCDRPIHTSIRAHGDLAYRRSDQPHRMFTHSPTPISSTSRYSTTCQPGSSSFFRHYLLPIFALLMSSCYLSTSIIARPPLQPCQLSPSRARVLAHLHIIHQG